MSNGPNGFHVRFLLATNLPVSITRLTADTAKQFAAWGVPTTVMFPVVDWWQFRILRLRGQTPLRRCKGALRLGLDVLGNLAFRRRWCGYRAYEVGPQVRSERFWNSPSSWLGRDEIAVVPHTYLLSGWLSRWRDAQPRMVGAIHINLEKAMQNPHEEGAAWYRHWVDLERRFPIPRYATSEGSRKASERLGIPIRKVIHSGIDLKLFHSLPAPVNGKRPLVATLYCADNPQKGRDVGVEVFRRLRRSVSGIELRSVGPVPPDQADAFDLNLGFLQGQAYAKALQESDLFVYPSRFDGFPVPPLEAMACGAAVATTAVEGVVEYAVHEENCLLAEPGNVGSLSRQVLRLVKDPALLEKLRVRGPETARAFSAERSARELLEFLREVHEEPAPPHPKDHLA